MSYVNNNHFGPINATDYDAVRALRQIQGRTRTLGSVPPKPEPPKNEKIALVVVYCLLAVAGLAILSAFAYVVYGFLVWVGWSVSVLFALFGVVIGKKAGLAVLLLFIYLLNFVSNAIRNAFSSRRTVNLNLNADATSD